MKKFIVAGILGTMLAFTNSSPANARDRVEPYRPGVHYTSHYVGRDRFYRDRGYVDRYTYLDRDYCDPYWGGRGIRYPWPTYQGDHYRLTYRC
jgi:hypothetical protein